jgi:hypothetical protein
LATVPLQQPYWGESTVNKVTKATKDAGNWVVDNLVDPVSEGGQEGFSYVTGGWDAAVDWAVNAIDDLWEQIQEGLQEFVGLFSKKVDLTFDFTMLNRDPNLAPGSMMVKLWGNSFDNTPLGLEPNFKLLPTDAMVRVRQWGWGFLPVMGEKPMAYYGTTVEVLRDDDGRGDGALCVELDNDYAMLTSDFIPNEICDFGLGLDDIPTEIVPVLSDQRDLHALTQIVDGAKYAEQVIGYEPNKADVLIGWMPNELTGIINNFPNIGGGNERAMTLCLDFPSVGGGAIPILAAGLGSPRVPPSAVPWAALPAARPP